MTEALAGLGAHLHSLVWALLLCWIVDRPNVTRPGYRAAAHTAEAVLLNGLWNLIILIVAGLVGVTCCFRSPAGLAGSMIFSGVALIVMVGSAWLHSAGAQGEGAVLTRRSVVLLTCSAVLGMLLGGWRGGIVLGAAAVAGCLPGLLGVHWTRLFAVALVPLALWLGGLDVWLLEWLGGG